MKTMIKDLEDGFDNLKVSIDSCILVIWENKKLAAAYHLWTVVPL